VTRLTDLAPDQAKRLAEVDCPEFKTRPWVTGPALSQRRVAIVSSAGLVVRGEEPFRGRDPHYHAIPATTRLERLRELAAEGTIGSMADTHYSFMGATDPLEMERYARELAGRLKQDNVDSVLLAPV